jgi:hypothetical protein
VFVIKFVDACKYFILYIDMCKLLIFLNIVYIVVDIQSSLREGLIKVSVKMKIGGSRGGPTGLTYLGKNKQKCDFNMI